MHARLYYRLALAVVVATSAVTPSLAGGGGRGAGGHGGAMFHPGAAFHGGHGGWGGGPRPGGARGLPPVAGVIHERSGAQPYFSAYGHTDTAARFGGFARGGVPSYGHTSTALLISRGFRPNQGGYGHVNTALRPQAGRPGEDRRRFGEGRQRFATGRGFGGFVGAGGFGGGYGYGDGDIGDAGAYGASGADEPSGTYGGQGTYGGEGTYGQPGTYGGLGTTATQSVYGTGGGSVYRSETPLAARFAEPPLGPSPGQPYSPGDRYAYAAAADVGPAPHVVNPFRARQAECGCGGPGQPVVYRYGVGTAY